MKQESIKIKIELGKDDYNERSYLFSFGTDNPVNYPIRVSLKNQGKNSNPKYGGLNFTLIELKKFVEDINSFISKLEVH